MRNDASQAALAVRSRTPGAGGCTRDELYEARCRGIECRVGEARMERGRPG